MEDDNQLPESEVGAEGDRENEHRRGNLPDRSPRIRGSRARGMEADRDVDEEGHEAAPVPDEAVEGEIVSGPSGYENPSFSAVVEHSGPLPPVAAFRGYDEVLPGSADRILRMAEEGVAIQRVQVESNAEIQRAVARSIDGNTQRSNRQQGIYTALTILIGVGAFLLAWFDKPVPAVFMAIVAFTPVFLMFAAHKKEPPIVPADSPQESEG
ncbi:DUF2335 domain-containing protein [Corynebacterium genitalium ATCC 33030]|nr:MULTISPECIES: DUF2335 domain-containing protein [Corynebacterium]MCQ4618969.1 DUF2335 domain-containing protein [Corynebacterium pseudogenitalium]MCQ4621446.1 DUF2335 domain-containing protein [Corynebacterium sp. CCUG 71335]MCQ4623363.1 DUF2335 domain-containing protein [Corynebacterium sp. CCUG 70398]UUA89333.1 DUF2335 domain-containing protein [Corynebacterium genitalium ATCC 33030]